MGVHHESLVVAYTWNREKQMFVALGKEFDMRNHKHQNYFNVNFDEKANETDFGALSL